MQRGADGAYVFVLRPDKTITQRNVKIGIQDGDKMQILSGLRAGDTVYFPRAAQVYVMGSVARPGPYRYQEGMTVLQALTLAEPPAEDSWSADAEGDA